MKADPRTNVKRLLHTRNVTEIAGRDDGPTAPPTTLTDTRRKRPRMVLSDNGEEARGLVVALRLRVHEGDREGRQAECQPHLMRPIPQDVLRCSPGCHVVPDIKRHLNEDCSRVRASENGEHTVLGQQIGQFADSIIAQRPAIVPSQLEPNKPRFDHPRDSSPGGMNGSTPPSPEKTSVVSRSGRLVERHSSGS